MQAGRFELTVDLTDFGTKLELPRPSADAVWDATDALTKILKGTAAAAEKTTTS
jgi:chemotaxis regulatin CheY-phosphate phosphatase CheZ